MASVDITTDELSVAQPNLQITISTKNDHQDKSRIWAWGGSISSGGSKMANLFIGTVLLRAVFVAGGRGGFRDAAVTAHHGWDGGVNATDGSKTLDDWIAPRRAAAIARIVKALGQTPRDEMLMAADIFQASCEKPSALVLQEGSQAQAREKGATHSQKRGKAGR